MVQWNTGAAAEESNNINSVFMKNQNVIFVFREEEEGEGGRGELTPHAHVT